jgi:predicted O-linked N-acetylglucosamine transferase (SPINDLY family)
MGASILTAAGLNDLIQVSEEGFVARCVQLATDGQTLRESRMAMRDRLKASPLLNEEAFVRDFEAALETAVRDAAGP